MSKSVSGITQRNKRSIQEVKRQRHDDNNEKGNRSEESRNSSKDNQPPGRHDSQRAATFGLWFVGVVGVLFVFFLFSLVFAETTVTVYPETADISINEMYTASNNSDVNSVPFSIITVEDSVAVNATTTGTEYREESASGEITIYNDYSDDTIRLVPNTRFQTNDGLIYRVREAVSIPGQSSNGEPGSITVTVYADESGEEYNISNTNFSIPGFSGTVYEDGVYAETAGSISGGIAGDIPIVSTSTRQTLQEETGTELEENLRKSLANDLPEGFILYEDGIFFSSHISTSKNDEESTTALTVDGEVRAIVFDARQLSSFLATNYSNDVSSQADVRIQDLHDFNFQITDRESLTPNEGASFEFMLEGESQIVWQYDERALVRDLRGLQKDRLNEVLVNYDSIQEAEVVTRPFWKQNLPDDAADITIQTVINR
jgi:hypothetical protein